LTIVGDTRPVATTSASLVRRLLTLGVVMPVLVLAKLLRKRRSGEEMLLESEAYDVRLDEADGRAGAETGTARTAWSSPGEAGRGVEGAGERGAGCGRRMARPMSLWERVRAGAAEVCGRLARVSGRSWAWVRISSSNRLPEDAA
jgi:hypothetical protein